MKNELFLFGNNSSVNDVRQEQDGGSFMEERAQRCPCVSFRISWFPFKARRRPKHTSISWKVIKMLPSVEI